MTGVAGVGSNKARTMDGEMYAVLRRFARLLAVLSIRVINQTDYAVPQGKANVGIELIQVYKSPVLDTPGGLEV